jgi:hypothetical protein
MRCLNTAGYRIPIFAHWLAFNQDGGFVSL